MIKTNVDDDDTMLEEIKAIKARNERVECDKAWETSWFRRGVVAGLTYVVVVLFFVAAGVERPYINALVPTGGFLLSTLSLDILKKWWIRKRS